MLTDNSSEVYAKINGQDGLLLTIQKQTGYSTGDVSGRLNDFFRELQEEDPAVHVTALMDQGIYIDMVVNSVLQNLGTVSYTHLRTSAAFTSRLSLKAVS